MKITRKQLKRIILKEFNSAEDLDSDALEILGDYLAGGMPDQQDPIPLEVMDVFIDMGIIAGEGVEDLEEYQRMKEEKFGVGLTFADLSDMVDNGDLKISWDEFGRIIGDIGKNVNKIMGKLSKEMPKRPENQSYTGPKLQGMDRYVLEGEGVTSIPSSIQIDFEKTRFTLMDTHNGKEFHVMGRDIPMKLEGGIELIDIMYNPPPEKSHLVGEFNGKEFNFDSVHSNRAEALRSGTLKKAASKPIRESFSWKGFLPDIANQTVTITGIDKSTTFYIVGVPKELYEPVLSSFYKLMGRGDEEKGLQEISQKPLEEFMKIFLEPNWLTSSDLETSYDIGDGGSTDSSLEYESSKIRANLIDSFVEQSRRYYSFVDSRVKEKSGKSYVDEYLYFSEAEYPGVRLQPELVDLDKALLFYGFFTEG